MLFFNHTAAENAVSVEDCVETTKKLLLNPKTESYSHLDDASRELVQKTIGFFERLLSSAGQLPE